jgi:hypothetical protein
MAKEIQQRPTRLTFYKKGELQWVSSAKSSGRIGSGQADAAPLLSMSNVSIYLERSRRAVFCATSNVAGKSDLPRAIFQANLPAFIFIV